MTTSEDSPEGAGTSRPEQFPIVGIGASAGGLEAFEAFLRNVPERSGMAFVLVQHLDPKHKGALVELLQRTTRMPVREVTDRMTVERDHVYVIPPNKDMSILGGKLHLLPQTTQGGLSLPIDFFLRALAQERQERAIGVILSGMGSDGTFGLRAVKANGGAAFVQSLDSAKFDAMPRSAIDAGLADVVAPVEELPARIVAYQRHVPFISGAPAPLPDKAVSALEKIFILLRAQTGNDFSQYKRSTILRRIERRMGLHQIENVPTYMRFLRENPREVELLFKELLIGVTSFFRDPAAWEHLGNEVIPALVASRADGGVIRAWVPGCSTGEEAYSLAMLLREATEPLRLVKNITVQIFATDLDADAIDRARRGSYLASIVADVTPERLRRFFVKDDEGYRVSKEIREMVVFASQNVVMDPPFTKLDILSCRNLLIYLSGELQKKLIPLFHYSLNPGGLLFLGSAETVGAFSALFAPLAPKARIYRRLDEPAGAVPFDFRAAKGPSASEAAQNEAGHPAGGSPPNLQLLVERLLVQRFCPAALLCNEAGDILYISGKTGRFLEPAAGKANMNVFSMARDGLRYVLTNAFASAVRADHAVVVRGVRVGTNGGEQVTDLTVHRLTSPRELRGSVLIAFTDQETAPAREAPDPAVRAELQPALAELEEELQSAREEAQTTREEMQTSQEELKSTNEELQSTNEELTTSKEEMQSLNEELQTVNHELQAKVDELSRSNNDMKNLLNSTDIATLFLDGELRVRRFTPPTAKLIKLIPSDAGRPLTDLASLLHYPELADDAREVLRTLVFREKQARARDGRWFAVRILPYRTLENVIDGVVITFTDISSASTLQDGLRDQAAQLRQLIESLPTMVWGCRPDGACDYLSRQWLDYTGISTSEQLGFGWFEQVHPEDRQQALEKWRASLRSGSQYESAFRLRGAGGAFRWFTTRAVPIRDVHGVIQRWYGTSTDVDDLKQAEAAQGQSHRRYAALLESMLEGHLALDRDLVVSSVNATAARLLGHEADALAGQPLLHAAPELADTPLAREVARAARDGVRIEPFAAETPGGISLQVTIDGQSCPGDVLILLMEAPAR